MADAGASVKALCYAEGELDWVTSHSGQSALLAVKVAAMRSAPGGRPPVRWVGTGLPSGREGEHAPPVERASSTRRGR